MVNEVRETLTVDFNGNIELADGSIVRAGGNTLSQVQKSIRTLSEKSSVEFWQANELSASTPGRYKIGAGDVLRISRLVEVLSTSSDSELGTTSSSSLNSVGPDGLVSILQLGEIEVGGATLPEARNLIIREAARNGLNQDITVEIATFGSQFVYVSSDQGSQRVPVTNLMPTYGELVADMNLPFSDKVDHLLELTRNGSTYRMTVSALMASDKKFFLVDGDIIKIQALETRRAGVEWAKMAPRTINFVRASSGRQEKANATNVVTLSPGGMDLRQLLVQHRIEVNRDRDLSVTVVRDGRKHVLSAHSVVLKFPNRRFWLKPDDHVIVEDLAYIGDQALLIGEVNSPKQLELSKFQRTTLSDALFAGSAFIDREADFKHIYVLRRDDLGFDAYHFDLSEVMSLSLAERFELRPADIVFVRTRPLTRYNRALTLALSFFNLVDTGLTNASTFGR